MTYMICINSMLILARMGWAPQSNQFCINSPISCNICNLPDCLRGMVAINQLTYVAIRLNSELNMSGSKP